MDFIRECEGIDEPVLAGGALAGYDRAYLGARAAGRKACLPQIFDERVDIGERNMLDFNRETRCHGNLTVAVELGRAGDGLRLLGGDLAVAGDDAGVEAVRRRLVAQEAEAFDAFDFLFRDCAAAEGCLYLIEEEAALEHTGICVAIRAQAVLQQIAALALGADEQELFIRSEAVERAVHLGEIYIACARNGRSRGGVDDFIIAGFAGEERGRREAGERAAELVLQDMDRLHEGMNGCGKRRRIGEIKALEFLELRTGRNSRDGNIGHLVHRAGAGGLQAEQLMRRAVGDETRHEERRAGVVMGLVVRYSSGCNDIEAGLTGSLFREARAGAVDARQLDDARADNTRIGYLDAAQHMGEHAALEIGAGAHRRPLRLAGHAVADHRAVTNGIDMRQIALELVIYENRALEELDAGIGKEFRVGAHTGSGDEHVGAQDAGLRLQSGDIRFTEHTARTDARQDVHAFLLQAALYPAGHICIEDVGQNLRHRFDNRYLNALCHEIFSGF